MEQSNSRWQPLKQRSWAVLAFTATLCFLAGCNSGITVSQTSGGRPTSSTYSIPGQISRLQKASTDVGSYDQSATVQLSVSLPLRNQAKLHDMLSKIYDPTSPQYHQFLTAEQFNDPATGFAPTADQSNQVKQYLISKGISENNISISTNHQFVSAAGSVANVESAFNVKLHQYKTPSGQLRYGTDKSPSVPNALAGLIQNVSGLDNFATYRIPEPVKSAAQVTGSGYTPQQIQQAYGVDTLQNQGIDGTGQTIAFLELDNFVDSDITAFQQKYNLGNGTYQRVVVGNGAKVGQGAAEVTLDMEIGFSIAPKANQLIYIGENTGQGINDLYSKIVNDNRAKQVSISWGLCEQSTGSAELQTLDTIFQQGAAQGISFYAASGDNGAYDCGDNNLGVDSPADDPWVTGVGGTSLSTTSSSTTSSSGAYASENAWACTTCTKNAPNGSGSGGGVSAQFGLPDFQKNVNPTDAGSSPARYVPDVSANADPKTGYLIYCTATAGGCSSSSPDLTVGGTSAAAPLWAGSAALINQYLDKDKKALGNANSTLYAVAQGKNSAFHDVTTGDNLNYKATSGYDLATGLGSPNVAELAKAIAAGNFGSTGNPTGTPTAGTPTSTPTSGGSTTPTPTSTSGGGFGTTPTPTSTSGGTGTGTGSGAGNELLSNGGFENGQSPWGQSSAGGYQLIDDTNPHKGTYSADLCGYTSCDDAIGQGFVVPNSVGQATLSYSWYMVTDETSSSCQDTFTVDLVTVDSQGNTSQSLGTLQNSCNTNANTAYQQKTVDITSLIQGHTGETLAIIFATKGNGPKPTRVFVDDVSLKVK